MLSRFNQRWVSVCLYTSIHSLCLVNIDGRSVSIDTYLDDERRKEQPLRRKIYGL